MVTFELQGTVPFVPVHITEHLAYFLVCDDQQELIITGKLEDKGFSNILPQNAQNLCEILKIDSAYIVYTHI